MKHLDLFSGIGGFALAVDAVWPKSEHIFCDNDKFCQQVLKKHWPNSKIYEDIRAITDTTGTRQLRQEQSKNGRKSKGRQGENEFNSENTRVDLLTGGFPCQPFSQAGKRRGTDDDRYLWPEMLRVIQLAKPRWIIAENVRGLLTLQGGVVFEQVCLDLEASGYEVQPFIIPAVAVNAPHRRDRVWFVAHRKDIGSGRSASEECGVQERKMEQDKSEGDEVRSENKRCIGKRNDSYSHRQRHEGKEYQERQSAGYSGGTQFADWSANWLEVARYFLRMDDGLSNWIHRYFRELILKKDYATIKNNVKNLRILWEEIQSEEIQERVGGIFKIPEKEVLLSFLFRVKNESIKKDEQMESEEDNQNGELREMWNNVEFRNSPQGRKLYEQQAKELVSLMPKLPYELAQSLTRTWYFLNKGYSTIYSSPVEIGDYKLSKAGHRNQRLKSLGNAIVPQVAIEIMKAIKYADKNI